MRHPFPKKMWRGTCSSNESPGRLDRRIQDTILGYHRHVRVEFFLTTNPQMRGAGATRRRGRWSQRIEQNDIKIIEPSGFDALLSSKGVA